MDRDEHFTVTLNERLAIGLRQRLEEQGHDVPAVGVAELAQERPDHGWQRRLVLHERRKRSANLLTRVRVQDTPLMSVRLLSAWGSGQKIPHGNPLVEDRIDHGNRDDDTEDNRCELATHFSLLVV
jgi:hypothetical protein